MIVAACETAIAQMDPMDRMDREEFFKLYEIPPGNFLRELSVRVNLGPVRTGGKLLFSGHVGIGKSAALYQLKRQMEAKATVIYLSVQEYVNLVGMTATTLLEAMVRGVHQELEKRTESVSSRDLEERIRGARTVYKKVRRRGEGVSGSASIELPLGLMKSDASIQAERGGTEEWVYERELEPTAMLALLNELLEAVKARSKKQVLLLVDDIEKLDVATAQVVFSESLALSEVKAGVVYTVPISMLFSESRRTVLAPFESEAILPVVKVVTREGGAVEEGVQWMRRLILRRLPELNEVISPALFEKEVVVPSGGVIRDLLRLMYEVCLNVIVNQRETLVDSAVVQHAQARLRNAFFREIPAELIPRLKQVHQATGQRHAGFKDPALARLLNLTAVLEFTNSFTWYRVHPMAEYLVVDVEPA